MIKKITFVGNFGVDFSTESHHAKTFEKLGIEVIRLQENQTTTDIILENALNSDMLYYTHTHGFVTSGSFGVGELFKRVKAAKVPSVGYHLDLWLGIERQKDLQSDPYWQIEYFFCTDKLMADWLNERKEQGYPKAFFLPAGVFKDECYLGTPRQEYKYDVIFVGSKGYHHEHAYRPKLVNWLAETYGDRFAHFGGDGKGVVRGKDLNDLYASAKVVVGDTLCKDFTYPYYLSDRVFETTGRGGFLIMPYIKGLEDLFLIDRRIDRDMEPTELITYDFNDFLGLKSKIDYYCYGDEIHRERVKKAGHERTKKDHTYTSRLTQLLKTIEDERNQNT